MRDIEPNEALPLAPPDREETAQRVFAGWERMSPEEWAARFAHTMMCSSFDLYRYRNAALHSWIHRLHTILRMPERVDECRKKYLTAEEIRKTKTSEF